MMQQPLSASLIRTASFAALFAAFVAIAAYSSGGSSGGAGAGPAAAPLQSTPNTPAISVAKPAATTVRVLVPVVTAPATALSESGSTLLTQRAHADLAGGVGAMVSLRVDGVVTDSVEVRATQPTDYALAAPTLKPGSLVDLVYSNDAAVNGVDRNLYVQQISTADTAVLPTAAIVSLDKGSDNAAFDGQNVVAGKIGRAHV